MADGKLRIMLMGAGGLVGGAILRRLVAASYSVLALSRDPSRLPVADAACVCAASLQLERITGETEKIVAGFAPDAVIHAAWMGTENSERNRQELLAINRESSLRLLGMAAAAGCKQWIGFGSQAEYRPAIPTDINEDMPTAPESPYGIAKLDLCHALRKQCAASGIDFLWFRLFACYGRESKPSYVIPLLIHTLRRGEMPELRTPHAVWDWLHADDAANALMAALSRIPASGVYNLASGYGVSVGDIALLLAERLQFSGIGRLRERIEANDTPATRRVADITKFTKDFGWAPGIGLSSGLDKCL